MKPTSLVCARAGARLAGLGLCALLTSCALIGNQPAPALRSYTLDGAAATATATPAADAPAATAVRAAQAVPWPVLLVDVPHAAPGYDSARMVYVRQPLTQEVFANSVWADTPARLLAPLLVTHMQRSGQFRAVLQAPSAAKADLRLDTTLLRLQQDFQQQPSRVHLRLQLTLLDNHTREVLAWRTIDAVHSASSDDADGGARAAQAAVQDALQQVAAFLQTTLAALPAYQ
jgi:cholesterol transport system auxiliary component